MCQEVLGVNGIDVSEATILCSGFATKKIRFVTFDCYIAISSLGGRFMAQALLHRKEMFVVGG